MIDLTNYDHLDFGASSASSPDLVRKALRGERGLLVTCDAKQAALAAKADMQCIDVDMADRAAFSGKVGFTLLGNCLERLSTMEKVAATLANAVHFSRSFVFVQVPNVDDDGILLRHGLKLGSSDRSVNTLPLNSLNFLRLLQPMLTKQAIARVAILARGPIADAADPRLLPLSAGRNSGKFDEQAHGSKPAVALAAPVHAQTIVIVARRDPAIVDTLVSRFRDMQLRFDSTSSSAAPLPVASPVAAKPISPAPRSRLDSPRSPADRMIPRTRFTS